MKYEGEVLRVEQNGCGAKVYLTNVRRERQPDWDDDKTTVEIAVPIAVANKTYALGRRVVVTVEAK